MPTRLIVGISGGSGAILAVRLLERLRALEVRTHLVVSRWGRVTLAHETDYDYATVCNLADVVHSERDMTASIASGSVPMDGMVVIPCSVRTLGAIAHGVGDNLLCRAADVTLKERRRLVLAVRETPLSEIHLDNMLRLSRMGVAILPPVPAFYALPKSVDDIIEHFVVRTLDSLGLHVSSSTRWNGGDAIAAPRNATTTSTGQ